MKKKKLPKRRKDDCLTASLSWLLEINYEEVPFYAKNKESKTWLIELEDWCEKRGYSMNLVFNIESYRKSGCKIIGVGKSPQNKNYSHAVVINDNMEVVHDPSYNKKRSIKSIDYILVFKEL